MHRLLFTLRQFPFLWQDAKENTQIACYSSWGMQLFCLWIENTRKVEVLFILNQEPLTTTIKNSRPPEIPHCVCMMPGRQNILRGKLELYNMIWRGCWRSFIQIFPFFICEETKTAEIKHTILLFFKCFCAFLIFFPIIFISWRLITLQYCSGFCHTSTWISHGFIYMCLLLLYFSSEHCKYWYFIM